MFGPQNKACENIWHGGHVWRPFWMWCQICFHQPKGHPKYSWESYFKCFAMLFGTQTKHVCTLDKHTHPHCTCGHGWQPCWIWSEIWFRQINRHPCYSWKWHLRCFSTLFGAQTRHICTLKIVNWRPSWSRVSLARALWLNNFSMPSATSVPNLAPLHEFARNDPYFGVRAPTIRDLRTETVSERTHLSALYLVAQF